MTNYADDNSTYACKEDVHSVIKQFEKDSQILLERVANPDKFHVLLSSVDMNSSITVDQHEISNSHSEKLLGVTIDSKLSFDEHVSGLCIKASQKLHAQARISPHMDIIKRTIMNAFINSQFAYCPLVWMFHSRVLNIRINKIHERALWIVCDDVSSFDELLNRDNSFTIHERKIQALSIELYKVFNGLSPKIMNKVFPLKDISIYCSRFPFKTRC